MKDGFWINYATNTVFEIDEHEMWLRRRQNAARLGVPAETIESFDRFTPILHRNDFLKFVMQQAPVMRVRGHGVDITFEFAARSPRDAANALNGIREFVPRMAGPATWLRMTNLETGETTAISCADFLECRDDGS